MPVDQQAEQLFSAWIARQQEGGAEPLEELVAEHPEQAAALEQMARRYEALEDVLAMIGMEDTAHSPQRELDDERRELLLTYVKETGHSEELAAIIADIVEQHPKYLRVKETFETFEAYKRIGQAMTGFCFGSFRSGMTVESMPI